MLRGNCTGTYSINYTGSGDGNCTVASVAVEGQAADNFDTVYYQLFPNITSAMPIESSQDKTTKDFIFVNNTANPVKVVSVKVKDGTHFKVIAPLSGNLPMTLQAYEKFTISISFDVNVNGSYSDELDIVTENGLTTQAFTLQGTRINGVQAGVTSESMSQPEVFLSPNPSHGIVEISVIDADLHFIDIYDILGNKVASHKDASKWIWNGKFSSGERATPGTYFVRASGITRSNQAFVRTSKLVLDK